jgi:6-pyruvoyltetrahydropterin/6-carboxytetrahydropterin synthase
MSWILRVRSKFQAAHFLEGYQGKCAEIHGHTFQVEVKITTDKLDDTGIGIDFTKIKSELQEMMPDHKLLNDVYDFNPTAENLSRYFFQELKTSLPVTEVTVWESDDASATYSENS